MKSSTKKTKPAKTKATVDEVEVRAFTNGHTPQTLADDMRHDITWAVRHLLAIDGIGEQVPCENTAALFSSLLHLLSKCEDVATFGIVQKAGGST